VIQIDTSNSLSDADTIVNCILFAMAFDKNGSA